MLSRYLAAFAMISIANASAPKSTHAIPDFECEISSTAQYCGGCAGYSVTTSITTWSDEYCGGCHYSGLYCVQSPSGSEQCFPAFSPLNGMECGTRSHISVNCPTGNGYDTNGDPCSWWYAEIFECDECNF